MDGWRGMWWDGRVDGRMVDGWLDELVEKKESRQTGRKKSSMYTFQKGKKHKP